MSNLENSHRVSRSDGTDFISDQFVNMNHTLLELRINELADSKGYHHPDVLKLHVELLNFKLSDSKINRFDFDNEFSVLRKRLENVINSISIDQAIELCAAVAKISIEACPKFLSKEDANTDFIKYLSYLDRNLQKITTLDKPDLQVACRNFFDITKSYAEKDLKGDISFDIALKIYKIMSVSNNAEANFLFGVYNLVFGKLENAEDLLLKANKSVNDEHKSPLDPFLGIKVATKLSLLYLREADNSQRLIDQQEYVSLSEKYAFSAIVAIKKLNSDIESLSHDLLDLYNESCSNLIKGYLVLGKSELAYTLASTHIFKNSHYFKDLEKILDNLK